MSGDAVSGATGNQPGRWRRPAAGGWLQGKCRTNTYLECVACQGVSHPHGGDCEGLINPSTLPQVARLPANWQCVLIRTRRGFAHATSLSGRAVHALHSTPLDAQPVRPLDCCCPGLHGDKPLGAPKFRANSGMSSQRRREEEARWQARFVMQETLGRCTTKESESSVGDGDAREKAQR